MQQKHGTVFIKYGTVTIFWAPFSVSFEYNVVLVYLVMTLTTARLQFLTIIEFSNYGAQVKHL